MTGDFISTKRSRFLAERGIKHATKGRPDRFSRTYEGRRLTRLRALVTAGVYSTVEEADRAVPRRNRRR